MNSKRRRRVKVLLIGEFEVRGRDPLASAQVQLDAFREAVQPAAEYGLTLYQASAADLAAFAGALWMLAEPPASREDCDCSARHA
jgi:hypothetical protein